MITAIKRYGNGLSVCARCRVVSGWGLMWDSNTYNIEGLEGVYCYDCIMEIAKERGEKSVKVVYSEKEIMEVIK